MKNITIDNQQATLNAYVAGLYDGEGTFCLTQYKQKNGNLNTRVCIMIANTDISIIKKVLEFMKINNLNYHLQTYNRKSTGRKIQYHIEITRHSNKIKFIELVCDYLTKNKEYAKLLKKFCEYKLDNHTSGKKTIKPEKEIEFYNKYRVLRESSETLSQTVYNFKLMI